MSSAAGGAPTKVYVHLLRGQDAEACAQDFAKGNAPEASPYGFARGRDHGLHMMFSRDAPGRLAHYLGRISMLLLGFDAVHAFVNRGRVRRADIIWTMTEGEAFAISFLFTLGLAPRRPLIANTVWVIDQWSSLSRGRQALYRSLARSFSVLTVHSRACLAPAQAAFPGQDVRLVTFGINADLFTPRSSCSSDEPPIRIAAAGNDRTRDWDTLLRALGNDPRFAVKLACRWVTPEQAAAYPTVELLQNPSMAAFRALYEWADFIAIPMRENIFSGITVALEAAALGTPILSARTGAIPTYFPDDAIFYYPVGDAEALRHIAASASVDERSKRAARARAIFLQQDYSTAALVRQYIAISRDIAPLSVGIRPDQPSGGRDVLDAAGADATA